VFVVPELPFIAAVARGEFGSPGLGSQNGDADLRGASTVIAESREYIEFYGKQRDAGLGDRELFDAMMTRYPEWVSRQ
jgi:hypothetical protein